jgi:hypothetical protein
MLDACVLAVQILRLLQMPQMLRALGPGCAAQQRLDGEAATLYQSSHACPARPACLSCP